MVTTNFERASTCCSLPSASGRRALRAAPTAMLGGPVRAPLRQQPLRRQQQQQLGQQQVLGSRGSSTVAMAQAAPPTEGPILSSTEVPAFIPRDDFADQMVRWCYMEQSDSAVQKFGMAIGVEEVFRADDGRLWGTNISFLRNGESVTTLYCGFDDEALLKSEWVGMDDLGFPVPEGNMSEVQGKNYQIRKVCDNTVDEEIRNTLKQFCKALGSTINNYYAFGSVFTDEL